VVACLHDDVGARRVERVDPRVDPASSVCVAVSAVEYGSCQNAGVHAGARPQVRLERRGDAGVPHGRRPEAHDVPRAP